MAPPPIEAIVINRLDARLAALGQARRVALTRLDGEQLFTTMKRIDEILDARFAITNRSAA